MQKGLNKLEASELIFGDRAEELLDAVTLSDEVNINETELNNATSEEE